MYKKISEQALQDGLKVLQKNFGSDFVDKNDSQQGYKAIPTGHDDLDAILTRGATGLALGGICELFGAEGSGKTSLAMRTIGMAQELGLHCAWFDAEHSWSWDLAKVNRCDQSKLIMPKMTVGKGDKNRILHAKEVLNMMFHMVWGGSFSIVVLDSVAALMPERVADTDMDPNKQGMGELARSLGEQMSKISTACAEKECVAIFINQIRYNITDKYNPITTPGGKPLKFYASQRISVTKMNGKPGQVIKTDEEGREEIYGHYARVKVVKNRRHAPYHDNLEIPIYYKEYFPDAAKKCYDLARKLKVISTNRGILTWKNDDKIVCQLEGESLMLNFIRGLEGDSGKEAYLAHCCVEAAKAEKNQKLKIPHMVPSGIVSLAEGYTPVAEEPSNTKTKKLKPKKKTKKSDLLELD